MRFPVVVVHWDDAFIETDDFDEDEAHETRPVHRRSVGFLISKNQYGYVLATDEYDKKEDGVAAKMFIPHGMVTHVTRLHEGETGDGSELIRP